MHDESTEDEGFVENVVHDPLKVTEEESLDDSIIVIEDEKRYIQQQHCAQHCAQQILDLYDLHALPEKSHLVLSKELVYLPV